MIRKFQSYPITNARLVIFGRRREEAEAKPRLGQLVVEMPKIDYLLCICDWCGKEEVIDPPDYPNEHAWRVRLKELFNWMSFDHGNFCSRKCEFDFRAAKPGIEQEGG